MIEEQDFIDNTSQFRIGKSSMTLAEEESKPKPEDIDPNFDTSVEGAQQVAGLNIKGLGAGIKKLMSKTSDEITGNFANKRPDSPSMSLDETSALVEKYNYANEAGQPINSENLGKIMNAVESTDDLNRLVDIAGTAEEKITKQTFEDIAADSDVAKDLAPILSGTQEGLFSAKQQYGMRKLLVTLGDESTSLAAQIANGDHTPETLLAFKRTYSSFESIYGMASDNATETARALNQQKMIAKALDSKSIRSMKSALDLNGGTGGTDDSIVAMAEVMSERMNKGGSVIEAMAYVKGKNLTDYRRAAVELWKNNILSGIGTHVVNLSSVAAMNMYEHVAIRPAAWAIGKIKQVAGGEGKDRVYSSEFMSNAIGASVGLRSSVGMFFDTLVSGESKFGKAANKMEHTGAIDTIAGNSRMGKAWAAASTMSFRLLTAEDEAMRGIAFTSELYALATRRGRQEGHTGTALVEYVDDMLDNVPDNIYNDAMEAAQQNTFTKTSLKGVVGSMAKYSKKLVQSVPELGFIMPFVNTPANLIQYAMDNSILATVSPRMWQEVMEGGAKGDIALAKMAVGTSVSLSVWELYEQGFISGSGPQDPAMRAQMEKEGWKPNGVRVDDTWYQIKKMEPFSTSMAFIANGLDKVKYAATEEQAKQSFALVAAYIAETGFDSSWMANLNEFMQVFSGGEVKRKGTQYVTNFGASLVPYSAAVRTIEQVDNPVGSRISNDKLANRNVGDLIIDKIKSNTRGYSDEIRPARYWDGTVKQPAQGGFSFAMSPFKEGDVAAKNDIANAELVRNGVAVKEPSSMITIAAMSFSLLDIAGGSDVLYDMYVKSVGKARREVLDKVVDSRRYGKLNEGPNGERSVILRKAASVGAKQGLVDFLKGDFTEVLEKSEQFSLSAQAYFGADPISFIKDLVKSFEDEFYANAARQEYENKRLNTTQKLYPTREPFKSQAKGVPSF